VRPQADLEEPPGPNCKAYCGSKGISKMDSPTGASQAQPQGRKNQQNPFIGNSYFLSRNTYAA
jgi:hypothetical protein